MEELARTGYSKLVGKSTQPVARKEKEEHKETVSVAGVPCDKEPEPPPQYYYTTGFNSKHHNKHFTFHHIPVNHYHFNLYFYFYDPIINYNPKHNYNRFTFNLYNNFTFNHLSLNYYHFNLYRLEGAMDIKQKQVSNDTNKKFGTFGSEATIDFQECGKAAVSIQLCDCSASYSTRQPGLSSLEKHTGHESWTPNSKVWMSGELLRSTVAEFYKCTVDSRRGTHHLHTTGYILMALMTLMSLITLRTSSPHPTSLRTTRRRIMRMMRTCLTGAADVCRREKRLHLAPVLPRRQRPRKQLTGLHPARASLRNVSATQGQHMRVTLWLMQRCAHAVGSKLKQECAHADLEEEQEPELAEKQGQAHHQEEGQELEQDPDRDCNNFGQSGLTRAAGDPGPDPGGGQELHSPTGQSRNIIFVVHDLESRRAFEHYKQK